MTRGLCTNCAKRLTPQQRVAGQKTCSVACREARRRLGWESLKEPGSDAEETTIAAEVAARKAEVDQLHAWVGLRCGDTPGEEREMRAKLGLMEVEE